MVRSLVSGLIDIITTDNIINIEKKKKSAIGRKKNVPDVSIATAVTL